MMNKDFHVVDLLLN